MKFRGYSDLLPKFPRLPVTSIMATHFLNAVPSLTDPKTRISWSYQSGRYETEYQDLVFVILEE